MANHERGNGAAPADGGPERAPRTRSAGIVRALVAAAVAAAAPAAGCYESEPGDDAADSADARDLPDPAYGVPDAAGDLAPVYAAPVYGVPEYGAPADGTP